MMCPSTWASSVETCECPHASCRAPNAIPPSASSAMTTPTAGLAAGCAWPARGAHVGRDRIAQRAGAGLGLLEHRALLGAAGLAPQAVEQRNVPCDAHLARGDGVRGLGAGHPPVRRRLDATHALP